MSAFMAVAGLVALVQGVTWLGAHGRTTSVRARQRRGLVLAPAGALLIIAALARAVSPGFF